MRMYKTPLLLMGTLLLVATARANTTPPANCAPFPVVFPAGTGGPSPVSCPPFTVPGGVLTGVTLSYEADYQFGGNGTNSVNVTFAPAGPAGVTWSPASVTLTVTGGVSSGTPPTGSASATAGVSNAAFASAFNVNLSSAVVQGSVADSSGAVSIVYTYTPPPTLTLSCSAGGSLPSGQVGTPYSASLSATGGVPPYTFAITGGSLPPGLTLSNTATGAITGTPTTTGTFTFTAQVTDVTGAVTTSGCSIVIGSAPPPPTTGCNNSAATLVFPTGPVPENAFLIRYAANLNAGDSVVDITNYGLNGAPLQGPGFGSSVGNICVNVYTFSPDEQLASCCSCLVTPNAVVSLSVNRDLLGNTLTPVKPNSVVIKLVASTPGASTLTGGMAAWGTTLHPLTAANAAFRLTETPFTPATLSAGELASITGRCASNIANGSGFGVCAACRAGALGANNK